MSTKESLAIGVCAKSSPIAVDLLLDERVPLDGIFESLGDAAVAHLIDELARLGRAGFVAKLRKIQPELAGRPDVAIDL